MNSWEMTIIFYDVTNEQFQEMSDKLIEATADLGDEYDTDFSAVARLVTDDGTE